MIPIDGLKRTDNQIALAGKADFGGQSGARMELVFSAEGSDVQLNFKVALPASWKFSDSFAPYAGTFFDDLALSAMVLSQTATTAQPSTEWQFTSEVVLTGPLAPIASLVSASGS